MVFPAGAARVIARPNELTCAITGRSTTGRTSRRGRSIAHPGRFRTFGSAQDRELPRAVDGNADDLFRFLPSYRARRLRSPRNSSLLRLSFAVSVGTGRNGRDSQDFRGFQPSRPVPLRSGQVGTRGQSCPPAVSVPRTKGGPFRSSASGFRRPPAAPKSPRASARTARVLRHLRQHGLADRQSLIIETDDQQAGLLDARYRPNAATQEPIQ